MKKQYNKLGFTVYDVTSNAVLAGSVPGDGGTNDTPNLHGQAKRGTFGMMDLGDDDEYNMSDPTE